MNAFSKTKTTFRSKFSALGALFLVLNFATAWGQETDTINMTQTNGSTTMQCGTTYTLILSNQNGDRKHTFTNLNGGIYVEEFTFYGVMKVESTRTRTRTKNWRGQWGEWSAWSNSTTNNTFDYLTVGENVYGNLDVSYSGLEPIEQPSTETTDSYNNYYEYTSWECVQTETTTTYYRAEFTIPSISVNNATSQLVFSYTENTGYNSNTNRAGFTATIKPICCPDCPTLTETIATTDGATSATLSWGEVSAAATYSVAVTKDGASYGSGTYNRGTTESLQLSNLSDGTYTWTLTFIADGCTVSCEPRTFMVCSSLSCPTNLQPANGTVLERRLLSWDPVPCADKYTVYVAPTSVGIGNLTTSTDNRIYKKEVTTTELHLPIMAQGDYYWTVIPKNSALGELKSCRVNSFSIRYASSEDHDISPSTQGTDFYFSLMENGYYNSTNCTDDRGNRIAIHEYTAVIAPKGNAVVTFYNHDDSAILDTFHVEAGKTRSIPLDEDWIYHDTPGEQKDRTIHVESTADISLYIANEACNSFDASIVLPTHALGTEYMVQSYAPNENTDDGRSCFMVIATQDYTDIEISGTNSNSIVPSATSVTLHKGESYFVTSTSYNVDLSGIKVSVKPRSGHPEDSCKTIVVFNGNTLTNVPNNSSKYNMDHIFEQAYPISHWGTKFAITSSEGWQYGGTCYGYTDEEYIRITASESATAVTIRGTVSDVNGNTITSDNLSAGQTKTYKLHRTSGLSCYIETSKPAACYLYQRSGCSTSNYAGDPSMVWIAPIERGIEKITFSTFAATGIDPADHYVNIVIPADSLDIRTSGRDERKTVWLGNTDITREFQTDETLNYVKGSNYKYAYARVKINHGTYTVYSNCGAKMVLHVYGIGDVRGYAYNAGSAAVPYKSAFSIGDGEREFDMTALPTDYHFCSGQEYVFRVSSNGDMDSVIFDFQNGERKTLKNISPTNNTVHHTITQGGNYRITSYVFSTVYNHDLCQKEIVVDTVEDYTFIFLSEAETVNDSVCYNTPYTYTRKFWTYASNGELVETTFTHNFNTSYASDQTLKIDNAKSQYGCDIKLTINLKVFGQMTPGAIGSEEVKCEKGSDGGANLSVTMLTNSASASGGPSDAHYEWQKRRITSISGADTTWADNDWITITNQTNPTYTVTEPAAYRRVYTSATCGTVYSNLIYVSQAGSFVPGTHIDEVVRVCNYETVNDTIGGELSASSIQEDGTGYYVVVPTNNTQETIRLVIYWEKSEGTQDNWQRISGATSYNYTINQTFSISTYFRRIIDLAVTDCNLNLSMGVFAVEVKPDYTITEETLSGCYNNNNASALLSITGGSGNFGVTYKLQNSSDSPVQAVLQGGKYKCSPLNQGVNYTYTVVDNTHGCTKTDTINIANPTPLSVATISDTVEACQGSTIQLPIPAITGGMAPYSVVITSSGLGISESSPLRVTVQTPGTQTSTSYNVPLSVSAGNKTLSYQINDINNCPITSDQTVVKINAVPVFELTSTPLGSCSQPNATITATVTNAPASPKYDYTINPENRFSATNRGTTSYTFGSTVLDAGLPQGTYEIVVTDKTQTTSCATKKEHTISSAFQPNIEVLVPGLNLVAVNQYSGCPNKDITVSVSSINDTVISSIPDGTYKYKIDATAEYGTSYTFTGLKTAKTCGTQIINVYVREESSGCEFVQEVKIMVEDNANPTIDTSLTNVDVTTYFCPTYTVPEVDYIKKNIKDYISDNCASDDDLSVSVTPNTGTFNVTDEAQTVTITVKDLCGNDSERKITITPKPWPNFKINGTDTNCYCHGDNIVLTAVLEDGTDIGDTYDGAKSSYRWYKDGSSVPITDGGRYSGATTNELKISSAVDGDAGVYKLVITDPKGCKKEATIMICVHPNIKFNLE